MNTSCETIDSLLITTLGEQIVVIPFKCCKKYKKYNYLSQN